MVHGYCGEKSVDILQPCHKPGRPAQKTSRATKRVTSAPRTLAQFDVVTRNLKAVLSQEGTPESLPVR